MEIKSDLHIHSTFSDGKYDVEKIIENCMNINLANFCITDHDTFDHYEAISSYMNSNSNSSIEIIYGTEISAMYKNFSIHVLAYNINKNNLDFINLFNKCKTERKLALLEMGRKLVSFGLDIDYEKHLLKYKSPGRPHLAKLLIDSGYCHDMDHAFENWLGRNCPGFVNRWNPELDVIIQIIKDSGGKAFIAHPGLYHFFKNLNKLKELNFDGIEVFHPNHSIRLTNDLIEFALNNNLLISGGSDFHGWNKDDPKIGSHGLSIEFVDQFYEGVL